MLRNSLSMPKSRLLNLTGSMSFIALGMYIILAAQKFEEIGKVTPVFIGTRSGHQNEETVSGAVGRPDDGDRGVCHSE